MRLMLSIFIPLFGIAAALFTTSMRSADRSTAPTPATVQAVAVAPPCTPPPTDEVEPLRPLGERFPLSEVQYDLAIQLIAIFENRERTLQYPYVEYLGDGRGYTSGIVGFTTGTGDALLVIRQYEDLLTGVPEDDDLPGYARDRRILSYLPELERIEALDRSAPERDEIGGLGGYADAWMEAAEDPLFRAAQDSVFSRLYYQPALELASVVGVRSGFGRAQILDAIIQHGGGYDPDGLPAMLALTYSELGSPADWDEEWAWMDRFLEIRDDLLYCAHGDGTREAWRESRTRVNVYRQILEAGNLDLSSPLRFNLDSREWVVAAD